MNKEIAYTEYAKTALETLAKGAFLTTTAGSAVNTMTIGWGNIGHIWQKPICTVMVRSSRYTYDLIEKSSEFTVSIPTHDMKEALMICGTKSGRDMDKIKVAGLSTLPGKAVNVPIIANCGLHFECKIVYKQKMDPILLDKEFDVAWYKDKDYHTMYYGEIVTCYKD